jgi:Arc/MetJ-type ribon-helix-helix transcriptional regulator
MARMEMINVRIPRDLAEELDEAGAGMPRDRLVRQALREWLQALAVHQAQGPSPLARKAAIGREVKTSAQAKADVGPIERKTGPIARAVEDHKPKLDEVVVEAEKAVVAAQARPVIEPARRALNSRAAKSGVKPIERG